MSITPNDPQRGMTPEFRVSYPYFFEPQKPMEGSQNKDPQYSCQALFSLGQNLDVMKSMAMSALTARFGDKMKDPEFVKTLRSPFRNQGDKAKADSTGKKVMPDGYVDGAVFVTLKNKTRPGLVGPDAKTTIMDSAEIYAGCYGRAIIRASAYPAKGKPDLGNRGVSFYIEHFQKTRDGESLTGRTKAEDSFEPVAAAANAAGAGDGAASIFG